MGIFDAVILGLVQGITEFLPISSSGHLILVRDLFGFDPRGSLAFDAVLHLATALAILIYFRRQILDVIRGRNMTLLWAVVLGTIPAAVIGFFFQGAIEEQFRSSMVVVGTLILGSVVFVLAEVFAKRSESLTIRKGVWAGLYQTFALIPGFSRSGMTISGGMLFGMNRREATDFAFLLGLPILLGVGILKLFEIWGTGFADGIGLSLLIGSVVSFATGLAAIHFMVKFVENHSLYPFVVYRILLAVVVFFLV